MEMPKPGPKTVAAFEDLAAMKEWVLAPLSPLSRSERWSQLADQAWRYVAT